MRYAFRLLARTPVFSAVAILTLALGLGANTAIFTRVDALLLRPLPYRDPDRLVMLWQSSNRYGGAKAVAPANFADWKNRNRVLEDMAYSWDNSYTITGNGEAVAVPGYQFSDNYFPLLGAKPFLGRTFLPGEGGTGREYVVVLSYKLWQSRFAADRKVIGRAVILDGKPYTVIGVMPREFAHPPRSALWTPLALDAGSWSNRHLRVLRTVARLKPGVSMARAQSEMNAISAQLEREFPADDAGWSARLQPIRDRDPAVARALAGGDVVHAPHRVLQHRRSHPGAFERASKRRFRSGSRWAPDRPNCCGNFWPKGCCSPLSPLWRPGSPRGEPCASIPWWRCVVTNSREYLDPSADHMI